MDNTTPATGLKVFLLDSATDVRRRLARLLVLIPGVSIVGECQLVEKAFERIVASRSDIAMLDPCFAGKTDLVLIEAITRAQPSIVCIVLTNHCATALRQACKAAGAHFFFDKTAELELICRTVTSLANAHHL